MNRSYKNKDSKQRKNHLNHDSSNFDEEDEIMDLDLDGSNSKEEEEINKLSTNNSIKTGPEQQLLKTRIEFEDTYLDLTIESNSTYQFDHLYISGFKSLHGEDYIELLNFVQTKQRLAPENNFYLQNEVLNEFTIVNVPDSQKDNYSKFNFLLNSSFNMFGVLENKINKQTSLLLTNNNFSGCGSKGEYFILSVESYLIREDIISQESVNASFIKLKNKEIIELKEKLNSYDLKIAGIENESNLIEKKIILTKAKIKKEKELGSIEKQNRIVEQEKIKATMKELVNIYEKRIETLQKNSSKILTNNFYKAVLKEDDNENMNPEEKQELIKNRLINENEYFLCVICMQNIRNCVFLDCGHLLSCFDCAVNMDKNNQGKKYLSDSFIKNGDICCPLCKVINKKYRRILLG